MRSSARSLSFYPVPRRAAAQLRLALDTLADAPTEVPAPIPLRAHLERVRVVLHPRLAWPDRPQRVRLPDGTPAPRRADFYDWILVRRRHAQIAARRAVAGEVRVGAGRQTRAPHSCCASHAPRSVSP